MINQHQKTLYMRKWREKKLKEGWRNVGWTVPADVADQLVLYKRYLLGTYKKEVEL